MAQATSRIARFWRHAWTGPRSIKARFGADGFARIEAAIAASEAHHGAELRFAVEAGLEPGPLWRGLQPRDRARQHFSHLRVWDTELNNGILIYLLLADRAVEVLADREAMRRVPQAAWDQACATMTRAFASGEFAAGVVAAIEGLTPALAAAFPRQAGDRDELPNQVSIV